MPNAADQTRYFKTLAAMRVPGTASAVGWILVLVVLLTVGILAFVPWVQTAHGGGQVVATDPGDRQQQVTSLVQGRVEHWYVHDGQRVSRGDPIARVADLDPELLERLASERALTVAGIAAIQQARSVAAIDVDRTRQLMQEGLAGRRDYELTQIKVADADAKLTEAQAKLTRIDIQLRRQSAQTVRAPRDGRVQQLNATSDSALVSAGTVLAVIAPEQVERTVELYIAGRDVPLVRPGRPVRLEFEGWPAIQFSGWPSVAQGMFDGRVRMVDPNALPSGLFRVLVEPMPGKPAWPGLDFARPGAKVRGWIQGETVLVGYELWRQLNGFPLEFGRSPYTAAGESGKPDKGAKGGKDDKDEGSSEK